MCCSHELRAASPVEEAAFHLNVLRPSICDSEAETRIQTQTCALIGKLEKKTRCNLSSEQEHLFSGSSLPVEHW